MAAGPLTLHLSGPAMVCDQSAQAETTAPCNSQSGMAVHVSQPRPPRRPGPPTVQASAATASAEAPEVDPGPPGRACSSLHPAQWRALR